MEYKIFKEHTIRLNDFPVFPSTTELHQIRDRIYISEETLMDLTEFGFGVAYLEKSGIPDLEDERELLLPVELPIDVAYTPHQTGESDSSECYLGSCPICQHRTVFQKDDTEVLQSAKKFVGEIANPLAWAKLAIDFVDVCQDKYARPRVRCSRCSELYVLCYLCSNIYRCIGRSEVTCACGQNYRTGF
jgi:hypothetical protein